MQRAKAFFLVCAGVLMVAIAYHVGAQSARAQSGTIAAASVDVRWSGNPYDVAFSLVSGRTPYVLSGYSTTGVGGPVAPVPGTSPVVACGYDGQTQRLAVLLENGDAWDYNPTLPPYGWSLRGNVFGGGPTPTTQPTWGQLKTQYRR